MRSSATGRYGCIASGWPSRVSRSLGPAGMGSLLDLNQATLRNWVEERYTSNGAGSAATRSRESEEIRSLTKRVAELERANTRSSRPAPRFSLRRSSTADSSDRRLHQHLSGPVRPTCPICTVLSEPGVTIAPSTYYARRRQPVTDAELEDAYLANALIRLPRW